MTANPESAWKEVVSFLLTRPTLEQIIMFEGSEDFQKYVRYLRDKNRNGILTDNERHEMDEIANVGHFMRLLKISALEKIAEADKLPQP